MKTAQILGILILIASFASIVLFIRYRQKVNNSKFKNHFKEVTEGNGLYVTSEEIWNKHYYIGIDNAQNKLIYIKNKTHNPETVLIDLSEVKKAKTISSGRSVKTTTGNVQVIDNLDLAFYFNGNNIPEKRLTFYYGEEDMPYSSELQLTEKWEHIVNNNLNNIKK